MASFVHKYNRTMDNSVSVHNLLTFALKPAMLTASTINDCLMNDFIIDDIEFDAYLKQLDDQEAESDIYADLSGDEYADAVLSTIA